MSCFSSQGIKEFCALLPASLIMVPDAKHLAQWQLQLHLQHS